MRADGTAATAWVNRIRDAPALQRAHSHWEAEMLVKYALEQHGIRTRPVDFWFFRLRPNGGLHVSPGMEKMDPTLTQRIQLERTLLVRRGITAAAEGPEPGPRKPASKSTWAVELGGMAASGAVAALLLRRVIRRCVGRTSQVT